MVPDLERFPRDPDELRACEALWRRMPPALQRRAVDLLQGFRSVVEKRWGADCVARQARAAIEEVGR